MRWSGHVARLVEMRNRQNVVVRKPGTKILGRPRHRREGSIRMNLKETGWEVFDWMHLAQDRDQWRALVNMVMCLRVTYKARNLTT